MVLPVSLRPIIILLLCQPLMAWRTWKDPLAAARGWSANGVGMGGPSEYSLIHFEIPGLY
jgi:hypothetical protein